MNKEEAIVSFAVAALGGWLAAVARELKSERRRPSWKMLALETPGAVMCGLGSAMIMQLVVSVIKKRSGQ